MMWRTTISIMWLRAVVESVTTVLAVWGRVVIVVPMVWIVVASMIVVQLVWSWQLCPGRWTSFRRRGSWSPFSIRMSWLLQLTLLVSGSMMSVSGSTPFGASPVSDTL